MLNNGGHNLIIKISLLGFFAALFLSLAPQALAQATEITGTSTGNLLGPGINVENLEAIDPSGKSRFGSYERAIVKAVDRVSSETDTGASLKYNYTVQILSGSFADQTFTIRIEDSTTIINPKTGDLIMVFVQPNGSESPQIFFETYDRKNIYIAAIILLTLILLFAFGLRGLIMLGLLALTLWLGIYTTIPLYLRGWNLLFITFLAVIPLSSVYSLILYGWRKKTLVTILSTITGTLLLTIIAQIFASKMHLTVTFDQTVTTFFADHPTIITENLVLIGLILAGFAIIQDISSSISCGVQELKKIRANSNWRDLFRLGMNIGRDHAGTMSLILLFSWIGASLYIFLYRYELQTSWLHFFNQNSTSAAFILAIAGTIGIILSVPISALISSMAWGLMPRRDTEPTPFWKDHLQS